MNLLVLYPPHLAIQKENFIEIFRNVASYNLFYPMSGEWRSSERRDAALSASILSSAHTTENDHLLKISPKLK